MNRTFNNVKVQLLTHTFSDWAAIYKDDIPLRGEVCICTLTDIESSHLGTAANVLVKIGDGIHPYKELQYIGAYAIDCGLWCKKDNPEFSDFNQGLFKAEADEYLNQFVLNILNAYATKDWVEGKGYITESAISGLAEKSYVDEKTDNLQQQVNEKQDEITVTNKLPYSYVEGTPDIESYSKIADTAYNIGLEMDQNYKIIAKLYNINNIKLSESEPIDIPLESVVLSVHYDEDDNSIVITLRDGSTTIIPVTQLTKGLVNQEDLERDYTKTSTFARVALTGSYENLNDEPHDVSYFNNDAGYLVEDDIVNKLDVLTAGQNISIDNDNVISVTGLTWEKGVGLNSTQTILSEVNKNNASGEASVSEGAATDAHSFASHAEGYMTSTGTSAQYSHAEGYKTSTQGVASHTEGDNTVTNNPAEHAEGRYNKSNIGGTDATNTISSIGIGNGSTEIPGGNRKNAVEVMLNGDMYVLGIGDYDGLNFSFASTVQEVLNEKQNQLETGEGLNIMDRYISIDTNVIANVEFVNLQVNIIDTAKQDKLTAGTGIDIDEENNISCIIKGIPEIPDSAEDGTYALKASVVSGSVTYSWVKE